MEEQYVTKILLSERLELRKKQAPANLTQLINT
jgi:hypothetical protein